MVLLTGVVPAAAALGQSLRWGTRGRARATAAMVAADRLEVLRAVARRTTPACNALTGGSRITPGWSELWMVQAAGTGRLVTVTVMVPLPGSPAGDTLQALIACA